MSFKKKEAENLLASCKRCCCICHTFCGIHIELHHIIPKSEGGTNEIENAIPLCFRCHSEVHLGGSSPKGRKYSYEELRKHKTQWIEDSINLNIQEIEKLKNEILAYLDSFKINEIYNTIMGMSVQLEDLMGLKQIISKQLEIQKDTNIKLIDDPEYYFRLGNIELEYGNYSEARNHFNSALELGMNNYSLNFNLFKTEVRLGNYSKALYHYKQSINEKPELQLLPSKYCISDILGEGATAVVYKGFDSENRNDVLIKIFKGNITRNYNNFEQIQKQLAIIKPLKSKYILKHLDDGFFGGRKYVVYNFIEGQTLKEAIDRDSLTKKEKKHIIIKLCEAISFLHEKSILHSDIKPSNILLRNSDNLPVLSDFGSALPIGSITHTNISFTMAYAAPELTSYLAKSSNTDRAKTSISMISEDLNQYFYFDIYSLGVTIAELLTGELQYVRNEYRKIREEYSKDIEDLIIKMTSPEPCKRMHIKNILSQFTELFKCIN